MSVTEEIISKKGADGKVLVEFYGESCPHCKAIEPALDEISKKCDAGELDCEVRRIDINECPEYAAKYKVRSVPTLMIFRNGQPESRHVGALSKTKIEQMILD